MSKITEVSKQKKNKDRYNVFIDGQFHCGLSIEEIAINHIRVGSEIELSELAKIIKSDNMKFAFNLAIKYISFKRRTVFETKKHVMTKNIDEQIVDSAIQKVIDYKYLDDELYANDFVSYKINEAKFGSSTIKYKLKQKGISDRVIETAILALDEDTEMEICEKNYQKILNRLKEENPMKAKQKIYRSLASKGFNFDVISRTINKEEY